MFVRFAGFLLLCVCVAPACAAADESDTYNRVSFTVDSLREVENDWATAVIGVTHEDTDPARLADRINQDVQWGLGLAKAERAVSVRTGGYRTRPISDPKQNRLRRWRGGQDLVIEGSDPKALSALLGRLQEKLQLQSLQFTVSPSKRRSVEAEIIDDGLRAEAQALGRLVVSPVSRSLQHVHAVSRASQPGSPPRLGRPRGRRRCGGHGRGHRRRRRGGRLPCPALRRARRRVAQGGFGVRATSCRAAFGGPTAAGSRPSRGSTASVARCRWTGSTRPSSWWRPWWSSSTSRRSSSRSSSVGCPTTASS